MVFNWVFGSVVRIGFVLDNKYRWVLDRIVFLSLCSILLIFKLKVYMNDVGLKECDILFFREF